MEIYSAWLPLVAFLVAPLNTVSISDPVTVLVNYGGLAGAFGLVIVGRLHTTGEVEALKTQVSVLTKQVEARDETIKAKDDVLQALSQALSGKAIPAMAAQSAVLEQIPQHESALAALLRESVRKTEELTARLEAAGEKQGGQGER